ncbi:helix-turn-helix transcriptional regulator [Polaromonas sp. DSR2-3-2]|uniref:helix-turn-helix transcriptional regulator n=1 Tax=unclassified Polaromonas TaxID=2638319 RepID=UPI003CE7D29C
MTAATIPQFPDDFNLHSLLIFLNLAQVKRCVGISRSAIYDAVKAGWLPPNIKVGRRSARWLAHEIMAVQQAIAAGASTDALCELVRTLVSHRPIC